ncbi:hypothetical protein E2C01_089879 [Portunus trituberculatus]|uniref:Uncharacterized protein n=1 Tax=Portunus trituberculatus TaxID=210409 RepID=A0A5B7JIN7_PORTR|nr:hypothetical protein [Portunus trituberculatus]
MKRSNQDSLSAAPVIPALMDSRREGEREGAGGTRGTGGTVAR